MADVALGAVAAVLASVLFSVGLVLQSLEARTVGAEHALRLSLFRELLPRRRFVAGAAFMVLGFALHIGALQAAPLTVVQPALAAGLVVLLVAGARIEAQPVGARERAAVALISVGVVALALTAPQRTIASPSALALALALGGLAAIALAPQALAAGRSSGPAALAATIGAGAGYALTGLTTKIVSDAAAAGDWAGAALWLVLTALVALVALVDQTTGLQRSGATRVGAIIYVTPVVVPVLLAPVLAGEAWTDSPGGGVPLALATIAVSAGAAVLAGSRHVTAVEQRTV